MLPKRKNNETTMPRVTDNKEEEEYCPGVTDYARDGLVNDYQSRSPATLLGQMKNSLFSNPIVT